MASLDRPHCRLRQTPRQQPMRGCKAVLLAKPQVEGCIPMAALLDIAPYSAFFVALRKRSGIPPGRPAGGTDFREQHAVAKIGGEET